MHQLERAEEAYAPARVKEWPSPAQGREGTPRLRALLFQDRTQWNRFVAATATGHISQTFEWAEHADDEGEPAGSLHIGVMDGNTLVAALLLRRVSVGGLRRLFYYYAPRGPVCADATSPAFHLLIAFARDEARRRGAFLLRIEPNVIQDDTTWVHALRRLGFRTTRHCIYRRNAWVTDLRPDEGQILAGMHASWRRYIRSGAKRGLVIRQGTGDKDVAAFYDLLVETGRRDQFYVCPKAVYRAMLTNYSPRVARRFRTAEMALFLVEHEGEVVAAATVAVLGEWAWYLHGASSGQPEHRALRPNHPLQWACMRWAKARGARFYDWRTIPDNLRPGEELYGVYQFKRGFGGFERRVLPTHDLVLHPATYWPYTAVVGVRRSWSNRRRARERQSEHARERAPTPVLSENGIYVFIPNPFSDDPIPPER